MARRTGDKQPDGLRKDCVRAMSDELEAYPADDATAGVFQSLAAMVYASDDFSEV